MSAIPLNLIRVCVSALILSATLIGAATPGFLEGHLKIISPREVDLADQTPSQSKAANYSDYSLIILSRLGKQQVASVTVDSDGNYRVALPPGEYVIDVQNRWRHSVRTKPQPCTVMANETVRVDMTVDTGIR